MSGGNSFHSFAIRYLKDFCPFTLVKSGKFSWSDCLVVLLTASLVVNSELR